MPSPAEDKRNDRRERRFWLETPPGEGAPRLAPSEARHALLVLRLGPGDSIVGLDGLGRAWPLSIRSVTRGAPELEVLGEPETEPAPGEKGSPLPWIELAVSPPKERRTEDMVDRLVQLGVASIVPLVCQRTPPGARTLSENRRARLERRAAEACKQCGRLWRPSISAALDPVTLLAERSSAAFCVLDRRASRRFGDWTESQAVRRCGTRERPIVVVVGPEGGFTEEEDALFGAAGAPTAGLAPHTLRTETAAEAALSVLVERLHRGDR